MMLLSRYSYSFLVCTCASKRTRITNDSNFHDWIAGKPSFLDSDIRYLKCSYNTMFSPDSGKVRLPLSKCSCVTIISYSHTLFFIWNNLIFVDSQDFQKVLFHETFSEPSTYLESNSINSTRISWSYFTAFRKSLQFQTPPWLSECCFKQGQIWHLS
jgi:hypothetical protein